MVRHYVIVSADIPRRAETVPGTAVLKAEGERRILHSKRAIATVA